MGVPCGTIAVRLHMRTESLVEPEEIGKTSVNEGQMYVSLGFRKLPARRIGYGSVICAFDSAALEIRSEMSTSVQYW